MVGNGFCNYMCALALRGFFSLALVCFFGLEPLNAAHGSRTTSSSDATSSLAPLQAQPGSVSFSDVPVGETYTQPIRVTNTSENVLLVSEITVSSAELRISGIFLPIVIAPGTSENFAIAYRASKEGPAVGEIRMSISGSKVPVILPVRVSAAAVQTELTASEAAVEFGDVAIGSASTKEIRVKNTGNRKARISGISASGDGFRVSGGAVTLGPQQEALLNVQFAPKSEGLSPGELVITSPEDGSLLRIPLTATGARSSRAVVRLNWEESPVSVAGYAVYRSAEPTGPFVRLADQIGATEYVDSGLAVGHTYYYVVTAIGTDQAETEYSSPITATIPAA